MLARMTSRLLPLGVVAAVLLAFAPAPTAQSACDRDCLRGFITQYLDALIAHDPARLPVTPTLKFTEDAVTMKLGDGLWKTATRLRPFRMDILDVRAGVAGTHVLVEEGATPSMVALRMKIENRRIAEVETMVVRNRTEGFFFQPDALKAASAAMTRVPPKAQLHTRDEAIRIASLYPAGLRAGSFVKVDAPFGTEAYRLENGQLMAGPGCTTLPGCTDIKGQRIPTLAQLSYRLAGVDEELGIVWFRLDFGAGSLPGTAPIKLVVFEAFKVYDGKIQAIEAFMESAPMGATSGWEPVSAARLGTGADALVGTWTLDRIEDGADRPQPTRAAARGLLVIDAAGHIFEFVSRTQAPTAQPPLTEAQARFFTSSGFWGRYRADQAQRRVAITADGAVHPNLMGREVTRSFELSGDKLMLTSMPGELHTRGVTRWVWEKVAPVENLTPGYRQVVGFWQHVYEKRMNFATGAGPESRRAPSVIVYTPSGFVGVHFPPLNRKPFAGDVPTDEEARAATQGYVGYFGALTVYPNQVFHNILGSLSAQGGGTMAGTILKRFFELKGNEVEIRFPMTVNQQGQQTSTYVTLKRLSGAGEM
jgi:hypothetical protein